MLLKEKLCYGTVVYFNGNVMTILHQGKKVVLFISVMDILNVSVPIFMLKLERRSTPVVLSVCSCDLLIIITK